MGGEGTQRDVVEPAAGLPNMSQARAAAGQCCAALRPRQRCPHEPRAATTDTQQQQQQQQQQQVQLCSFDTHLFKKFVLQVVVCGLVRTLQGQAVGREQPWAWEGAHAVERDAAGGFPGREAADGGTAHARTSSLHHEAARQHPASVPEQQPGRTAS